MERLRKIEKNAHGERADVATPSSDPMTASQEFFESDKFFRLIDEVVEIFTDMQKKCKESYPRFNLLTP